jgi:hypothetical protein
MLPPPPELRPVRITNLETRNVSIQNLGPLAWGNQSSNAVDQRDKQRTEQLKLYDSQHGRLICEHGTQ